MIEGALLWKPLLCCAGVASSGGVVALVGCSALSRLAGVCGHG